MNCSPMTTPNGEKNEWERSFYSFYSKFGVVIGYWYNEGNILFWKIPGLRDAMVCSTTIVLKKKILTQKYRSLPNLAQVSWLEQAQRPGAESIYFFAEYPMARLWTLGMPKRNVRTRHFYKKVGMGTRCIALGKCNAPKIAGYGHQVHRTWQVQRT